MRKPLSMDLRSRALVAVDDGMTCRRVAAPFRVGPATETRWRDQRRRQAHCAPHPPRATHSRGRSAILDGHGIAEGPLACVVPA